MQEEEIDVANDVVLSKGSSGPKDREDEPVSSGSSGQHN